MPQNTPKESKAAGSGFLDGADGRERRVGVEIELAGIDLDAIARCVQATFGGHVERVSPCEQRLVGTELGEFKLELDFSYLKQLGREQSHGHSSELEQLATEAMAAVARNIVPFEVVSPPLPMSRLPELERLVAALRAGGALGTRSAARYAFGVHFNPELPALDVNTLLRYFKAYLCLHDWLSARERTDLVRRLSTFIQPFSRDYCRKVVDPDYWPDLETFIDDYLYWNPSRNRSLDMLPLFAWLEPARVRAVLPEEKINARPTLHYRLPNSDIDNPQWRLLDAWEDWLQVEALVRDTERLDELCRRYLQHFSKLAPQLLVPWAERVELWLSDPS
ncbi:amidoligase family protein [Marinobacterium aestuariivivens]|uniref:Amidoligase family protein n=1 Tax=Marinobacterium aestuariivivens TaxID=1698799 RepID=A0ABW1ZY17_9GAMM